MRAKIIWTFSGILLVVALLTFFLMRATLADFLVNPIEQGKEASRAVQAADSQLGFEAARIEKWLSLQAGEESARAVYSAGITSARQDLATAEANRIRDAAAANPSIDRLSPSLVLFTDARGIGLGRNGSQLMRGEDFGKAYPALLETVASGLVASALWVNQARQEQLLVSIAPVLSEQGARLGALVLGVPLNDDRLRATSEATSGQALAIVVGQDGAPPIAASSSRRFEGGAVQNVVREAQAGNVSTSVADAGVIFAASPLHGYGASKAVILGAVEASTGPGVDALLWPILLALGLGVILVAICGVMLGNYISKPIAEIEEGLLLLINGHRELRFDLEHAELGGLTSRINALLNLLLDVDEGETPTSDGRPSDDVSE
jgi:hypothetical protein